MELHNIIAGYKDDIVKSTREIISIKSVKADPREGEPFGEGVDSVLKYYLGLADKMGFKTKNVDGYAGHIEFGEGDEIIGILVHLDVVPEGDGWTYPPYGGEIHGNKIYGRGAIDDKGPAISVLYGLKAVKDMGIKLNKRVRIIAGLDEESRWECMKHYFKYEEKPACGFSPDADFPIINSEKGILIFKMRKAFTNSGTGDIAVKSIVGGNRPNMVPDYCEAVVECDDSDASRKIKEALNAYVRETGYRFELKEESKVKVIKSYGVSAHGSMPEKGQNAISQLLVFLNKLDLYAGDIKEYVEVLSDKIGMEYYGQSMGVGLEDEVSGKLIFNLGEIRLDDREGEITVNIRYPIKYRCDQVIDALKETLEGTGIEITDIEDKAPLYVQEDNFMIQQLKKVYEDITGEEAKLISIGGGTYARAIDNAVAFGPLFQGQPELAHQKDEYIDIDHLIKITEIYGKAILELAK